MWFHNWSFANSDGLGKPREQRLLFLRGGCGGDGVAGSGAGGAEQAGLTTFEPEGTDAIFTKGFVAVGATNHGGNTGVIQASERTVEQMGLDGRRLGFDFGNGDFDRFGSGLAFEAELGVAEAEDLVGSQYGFMDRFIVDEGAVGGIEVTDENGAAGDQKLAVKAGNRGVVNPEIVGRVASNAEEPIHQFDGTRVSNPGQQQPLDSR
jgi:hypothetical protein